MTLIPVNLAIEDELSEEALRRMLGDVGRFAIGSAYRRGGYGYLRKTIGGWNQASKGTPFLVLTDLDRYECPRALISNWLTVPQHPNLLFRVAVREVESWLLADPKNLSRFFGVAERNVPTQPDDLGDAKAALIDIARNARAGLIRDSIVPHRGSTAKQGPGYNSCLTDFVRGHWDLVSASANSRSLARTMQRLSEFTPVWG
jgi:hypothetical protein